MQKTLIAHELALTVQSPGPELPASLAISETVEVDRIEHVDRRGGIDDACSEHRVGFRSLD